MGKRAARSVPWSYYSDRGIATLSVTIAGTRHRPTLSIPYDPLTASPRDVRAVEEAAAAKYAELVANRSLEPGDRILAALTFDELASEWMVEAKKMWPKGWETRLTQIKNVIRWTEQAPRFAKDTRTTLERITDDKGPTNYAVDRLAEILRDTVDKEVSNLFQFFTWAVREEHLASAPPRPKLPSSAQGTRSGKQRAKPVDVTHEEAIAICAAAPEWAVRGGRGIQPGKPLPSKAFRVRDVLRLSYEVALRPGDAQKFEKPRHWTNGQMKIWISPDIDKTGWSGYVPLTGAAIEILERASPPDSPEGPIFGAHDLRNHIKAAALKVLPPEKARDFARYDFRHSRATDALETTNDLAGVSGFLRHTQMTTVNRYVRSREKRVVGMVAQLDAKDKSVRAPSGEPAEPYIEPAEEADLCSDYNGVRRAGLEPARCYPLAPQGESSERLRRLRPVRARQRTSRNVDRSPCADAPSSGRCQDGSEALLQAARSLAMQRTLWEAFDALALSAAGIDLDDDR